MRICPKPLFRNVCLIALLGIFSSPRGQPYSIGHTSQTFYDPDRNNRSIPTQIYYPAETAGDDVPPADPGVDGFPVVAFGHGYLMVWSAYENIWAALAPEGYIVAFPTTEGGLLPDHLDLGLDLAFLTGALMAAGSDTSSLFFGVVDSTSAVMGHSMGGGASFLAAEADTSITALVNMAAAETNPSAIAAAENITVPALVFSGSYDVVAPPEDHQIPLYNALSSACKTLVSITGGSHCQFAEQNFYCDLGEIGAPDPLIDRETQHAITNQFLLPWLDCTLRGNISAFYEFEDSLLCSDAVTYLHECTTVPPRPPVITSITNDGTMISLSWASVPFTSAYTIYSAPEPFPPEPMWQVEGTVPDTSWTDSIEGEERYYRITALR